MKRVAGLFLVLPLVLLACDDGDPTSPLAAPAGSQLASISGANDAFFFLPPLAPAPDADGVFNPELAPVVEICQLEGEACADPQPQGLPLRFTMDSRRSEAVRLVEDDEHYIVNWHTRRYPLDASKRYRIRVFPVAGGTELGHADVSFDRRGGGGSTLRLGTTLPIKFRIEQGILCKTDIDCTEAVVGPAGATVVTPTEHAGVTIPEGALDAPVVIIIERVDLSPSTPGGESLLCLPTAMQQAEGCYRYDTNPALSAVQTSDPDGDGDLDEFNTDVAVGVCIDPEVLELPEHHQYQLHKFDPEKPNLGVVPLESAAVPFVDCTDFTALSALAAPWYLRLASAGWSAFASPIGSLLAPDPLRAINLGFGGLAGSFSRIGWARALTMTVVAGDGQSGVPGSTLPVQPAVRVTANHYDFEQFESPPPVAGIGVMFAITAGGGSFPLGPDGSAVTTATVMTDENGIAQVPWILGAEAGANAVLVSGATREEISFTAETLGDVEVEPFGSVISAGERFTCVLTPASSMNCWGYNGEGQLGDGTTESRTTPAPIAGAAGDQAFAAVTAGAADFACGLTEAGVAYCWGRNTRGQLGTGDTNNSTVPVPVSTELRFTTISAGWMHVCAVSTSGAAYCWGNNEQGQLGTDPGGPDECSPLEAISSCSRTPVPVSGGLRFRSISAGFIHTCGITAGGQAYCWGQNLAGVLGTTEVSPFAVTSTPLAVAGGLTFASISSGHATTCGIAIDGGAYCWGGNASGTLGDGTNNDSPTPVPVAGGLNFASLDASNSDRHPAIAFTCGVATDGAAYCWGANFSGQFGTDVNLPACTQPFGEIILEFGCSNVPVPVSGGLAFDAVAVGMGPHGAHTCGLAADGITYCMGGGNLQFGDGSMTDSDRPTPVGQ